jgi:ATP-binding cassette subfamily G (WHITE) protein 2 (PDR)
MGNKEPTLVCHNPLLATASHEVYSNKSFNFFSGNKQNSESTMSGLEISPSTHAPLNPNEDSFVSEHWFNATSESKEPTTSTVGYKVKNGGYIFKNLNVNGTIGSSDEFKTCASVALAPYRIISRLLDRKGPAKVQILRDIEGFVGDGEMLAVLGKPGSGCTTLLKILAGVAEGLQLSESSEISYQGMRITLREYLLAHSTLGIIPSVMYHEFRGQCIYTAESDSHFPELTVWETIKIAVSARGPKNTLSGVTRKEYIDHITSAILCMFRLTSAKDTKIGNDLIRGVSGGERRRVTIAEAFASFAPMQFWDNSTRGMDSATALECIQNFQRFTRLSSATTTLSLYQASQSILDCFDKVIVLYEGQQIFFGTWNEALEYFSALGFRRPQRCTTGDFLTALTNPVEARMMSMAGWDSSIPVTANDFAEAWKKSAHRLKVSKDIEEMCDKWKKAENEGLALLRAARTAERSDYLCVLALYMVLR